MPAAPTPAIAPTAPVPPVTTPTRPPPARPPTDRRGHMIFSQQRLAKPLILEQVTLDPTWNWFKTVMVFVGGISVFLIFGTLMFWAGEWRSTRVSGASVPAPVAITQPAPAPLTAVTPVAPPVQSQPDSQPQWSSYADCQRHYVLTLGQDPEGACDSFK